MHNYASIPAFYHRPTCIDDLINQTVGRTLDQFGIGASIVHRWKEIKSSDVDQWVANIYILFYNIWKYALKIILNSLVLAALGTLIWQNMFLYSLMHYAHGIGQTYICSSI